MTVYDWPDFFEERAAIREFDAGHKRVDAETLTWIECLQLYEYQHKCSRSDAITALNKLGLSNTRKNNP